jgi:hypothetical protein
MLSIPSSLIPSSPSSFHLQVLLHSSYFYILQSTDRSLCNDFTNLNFSINEQKSTSKPFQLHLILLETCQSPAFWLSCCPGPWRSQRQYNIIFLPTSTRNVNQVPSSNHFTRFLLNSSSGFESSSMLLTLVFVQTST